MQVTPRRLRVALLSLTPRNQQVLEYFFRTTGYGSFSLVDEGLAEAAIFDGDNPASRMHWQQFADSGRPGIALSITEDVPPGAYRIHKPVTPEALYEAAMVVLSGGLTSAVSSLAEPLAAQMPVVEVPLNTPDLNVVAPTPELAPVDFSAAPSVAPSTAPSTAPPVPVVNAVADAPQSEATEPKTSGSLAELNPPASVLGWLGSQWQRLLAGRANKRSAPPVPQEQPVAETSPIASVPMAAKAAPAQDTGAPSTDAVQGRVPDVGGNSGTARAASVAPTKPGTSNVPPVLPAIMSSAPAIGDVPQDARRERDKSMRKHKADPPAGKTQRSRRPARIAAVDAPAMVTRALPESAPETTLEAAPAVLSAPQGPLTERTPAAGIGEQETHCEQTYCGTRGDLGAVELLATAGAFYQFDETLLAVLKEVYVVGTKWEVPTYVDCGSGGVTFIPSENRAYLTGFGEQELIELCNQPRPNRIKVKMLSVQEFSAMQDALARGQRVERFDALVWRLGLITARARLPRGTPLEKNVYLRRWPNLTRLELTPNALRIAALWATRGATLLDTARLLGIPQRHVFAFYNAVLALELLTTDGSRIRAHKRSTGRSGLLGKLYRWLQR